MPSWFRSWHGAPTDGKWLVIANRAKVRPGVVSAVAWALFDHASQEPNRGDVSGFDTETYAVFSGFDQSEIEAIVTALKEKGVITPGGRLAAWEKRQPSREDDSTERVKTYRAKKAKTRTPVEPHDAAPLLDLPEERKPRKLSVQSEMFGAVSETCEIDPHLKQGMIAKTAKNLIDAGYTPEQIRAFKSWWQSDPWRLEHTPVPSVNKLLDQLAQFKNAANRPTPAVARQATNVDQSIAAVDRVFAMLEKGGM